jgi:T5SS/PEP-CTERM-associated repeat protein
VTDFEIGRNSSSGSTVTVSGNSLLDVSGDLFVGRTSGSVYCCTELGIYGSRIL